ncbi:Ca-transporting ATPase [Vararia minispora EC-137]|uniref:Ca-transporting ATPase n=1 Tax=Vararia minispora EC-137 TaxID=1314806 RepID=A0ACB8QDN6_9AGAM|nr:Ca-transporting ATPase [Vararia minispora EC-137]
MSYGRRASDLAASVDSPPYASSSTVTSATMRRAPSSAQRQHTLNSQPASAYFSPIALEGNAAPQPTPDAPAHFAYSTTLRRNPEEHILSPGSERFPGIEPAGIWERLIGIVKGERARDAEAENGYALVPKPTERTAAAEWATKPASDALAYFNSSPTTGLPSSTVTALRSQYGYNEFTVSAPEPVLLKFAKTIYESPLILLLCGSALVSAVMGNIDDAVSITVAVLIVLTVGFVQERRSEKSLEALNKLVPHHCHIVRDGKSMHVLANEVVPGDIVTFSTGDRVPADIRLVSAVDLEIDESSLTGETTSRSKTVEPCGAPSNGDAYGTPMRSVEPVAMADRTCIAYMGTLVRNGRGSGVVIAIGTQTEFGIIFSMMQDVEERRTPLQRSMDELAHKLSMLSFGVIGIICLIGVLQQRSWLDMFTIGGSSSPDSFGSVSLAVAAIPEGLPIVTTVTLALGVLRMSKRKAIVKKLHSVEALGSISVICSDKTGTLTKNEQTVTELYTVDETIELDPSAGEDAMGRARRVPTAAARLSPAVRKALEIGALCNNASASRNDDGVYVGQSTDVALLNVLDAFQMPDPRPYFQRHSEKPFNSEQKYMAVSGSHANGPIVNGAPAELYYVKGSIESIVDRCKFYHVADGSTPGLDASVRGKIAGRAQTAASRGLRIIALAYGFGSVESNSAAQSRAATPAPDAPKLRQNLVFVGFAAMLDPPRRGVADAVKELRSGGVQVVMITGDAEETALSIAGKLGLGARASGCLTGAAIDSMSAQQLRERVGNVSVFARTSPKHKMAIVAAFQARGAVVAMTGDGVNDAPALKMADIGVSMGKSGTDVAKEAADVILVDDNFSTILPAVEEGKSIFHNIQNFLSFQLSTAAAALTLITLSTFFGLSNPLNAMQILFINILMDGPPSQSLGVDPVDPAVMRKPPREKDEPIISQRILYRVLFSATIIVCGTLFIYFFALSDDHMSRREQTLTFTCFVFLDLISAIQNRGLGCGLTQNRMLLTTVSVSFVSQLVLVYVPVMQAVFQTEALSLHDLALLLVLAGTSFALHEGRRRYERTLNAQESVASVVEEMA